MFNKYPQWWDLFATTFFWKIFFLTKLVRINNLITRLNLVCSPCHTIYLIFLCLYRISPQEPDKLTKAVISKSTKEVSSHQQYLQIKFSIYQERVTNDWLLSQNNGPKFGRMSTCRLLFMWASTINIWLSVSDKVGSVSFVKHSCSKMHEMSAIECKPQSINQIQLF